VHASVRYYSFCDVCWKWLTRRHRSIILQFYSGFRASEKTLDHVHLCWSELCWKVTKYHVHILLLTVSSYDLFESPSNMAMKAATKPIQRRCCIAISPFNQVLLQFCHFTVISYSSDKNIIAAQTECSYFCRLCQSPSDTHLTAQVLTKSYISSCSKWIWPYSAFGSYIMLIAVMGKIQYLII